MALFHNRLFSSYTYLNITQFLGALNDNIYKLLIVYFLIDLQGIENSPTILSITGAIFVAPFLLFSASSGILADRFSKRNIIVLTKILELVITAFGILVFAYESKVGAYGILFLLATQSAIFGPSKYGIIPELVSTEKISEANGLMTSFTFLAIILGTFLASFITEISGRDFVLAATFGTLISVVGVYTSYCIGYTPPSGSQKRFNILFLKEIYASLKLSMNEPYLFTAILGSAFFLFLGSYLQLNLIPFAMQSLNLTDVQGGYLFLITALGIGSGSILAGKICGKTAELGLVPIAGVGIFLSCFLLDAYSSTLVAVVPLVALAGMFGGMYAIPMDSYIQIASPNESRGQIIAATNFLSFFGVLVAAVMLYVNTEMLGFSSAKGFTIIGGLTVGVTLIITYQFFDYLTRFLGTILSRLHFDTTYYGADNVPMTPAIYVCTHTAWNDTLLILSSQRRRMHFIVKENPSTPWINKFYHLLRIEAYGQNSSKNTMQYLSKGISVCVFTDNPNVFEEAKEIKKTISDFPVIPVIIEKGEKEKEPRFFSRLYHKFRVPASVIFGQGA